MNSTAINIVSICCYRLVSYAVNFSNTHNHIDFKVSSYGTVKYWIIVYLVKLIFNGPKNYWTFTCNTNDALSWTNALLQSRMGRIRYPSSSAHTYPHVYKHCQRIPNHCLLSMGVFFTKLRAREANVWRSDRVGVHRRSI